MSQTTLEVGVIGAGTAGPAVALLLARAGHSVTLYERVEEPSAVGAGIVLQASGQAVMAKLGLLDEVLAHGAPLSTLRCLTRKGRSVLDLDYRRLHPTLFGLGLHRGVLFQVLFDAVRSQPGITLRLGQEITGLGPREPGGRQAVLGADGEAVGSHDVVIVCDGARSGVRANSQIRHRAAPYPWGALWFVGQVPEDYALESTLWQRVDGARQMLGLLPTGRGPNGDARLLSFFWSVALDDVERTRALGRESFIAAASELAPEATLVLQQIPSMDALILAPYFDVTMTRWHHGRTVFIGDSGHAMSPQLGQGCNLALVDAFVLAAAIEEHRGQPDDALRAYSRKRRWHLGYYQFVTRALTPFFQSRSRVLGALRDVFMGPMCQFPPTRALMTRSMAGTVAMQRSQLGGALPSLSDHSSRASS